ncbi:MAG: iron permease [Alphaproteobacteria bacterium]|nr:MAG: iron permease [Alphaproteobacteria bacterium]
MFPTATIVFREILEVSLVLGIVMAATQGMPRRGLMAALGLAIGIAGSVLIAFFTDSISDAIEGMGQEIFNACIMFIAVGFLSWTVIWMKRHGRDLAKHLGAVGDDVATGRKSLYVLVGVIALATFREGAEIALFTYGMAASGAYTFSEIMIGGLMGIIGGTIVGAMLYFGLLKTVKRYLFTVTSWMLIILTAGMAAQGANFLIAAGVLPELYGQVWDTSAFIPGHGFVGETLSVLIGYTPRPTGMELVFYCSVLFSVGLTYKLIGSAKPKPALQPVAASVPAE